MANLEHLAILKQGVGVWNEWREKNSDVEIDLSEADLHMADLAGVSLSYANLNKVNFESANLCGADLRAAELGSAKLNGTDLRWADLFNANFRNASLNHVNLRKAELHNVNLDEAELGGAYLFDTIFIDASLHKADFSWAYMGGTVFVASDISTIKGLEKVEHQGASSIGIDTIYKSKGNIPEVFMRGCGVPENMITFMRSLAGQEKAFEFYSCFISHSAQDKRFCKRLYADLQAKGVRVWYFPEDAKWGEPVWGEIDRSIKIYDKLIVVCSENSLQSIPVQREMERALNREDKEHKNILFPIRIDDYIFDHWEHPRKADVLAKVVGDFSGWERDAAKYEMAVDKLLKGLQAEENK